MSEDAPKPRFSFADIEPDPKDMAALRDAFAITPRISANVRAALSEQDEFANEAYLHARRALAATGVVGPDIDEWLARSIAQNVIGGSPEIVADTLALVGIDGAVDSGTSPAPLQGPAATMAFGDRVEIEYGRDARELAEPLYERVYPTRYPLPAPWHPEGGEQYTAGFWLPYRASEADARQHVKDFYATRIEDTRGANSAQDVMRWNNDPTHRDELERRARELAAAAQRAMGGHETAMMLSDMALYASDLSPEQRRAYHVQAAAAELRALAASVGDTGLSRAVLARSACWMLIDAGDPCRALKLARWALGLDPREGLRGELREVIALAGKRAAAVDNRRIRRPSVDRLSATG